MDLDFEALRTMSITELYNIGCHPWKQGEPDVLMLFPAKWYHGIPTGFILESISGEKVAFARGVTDNDERYGMLAYGIRVPRGEL
jgi:hypothetical protein